MDCNLEATNFSKTFHHTLRIVRARDNFHPAITLINLKKGTFPRCDIGVLA